MAEKNLQTQALRDATLRGVRVAGMECNGSLQADGKPEATFLFLPWHPCAGMRPIRTGPANRADNTATALTVERTGRSACGAGVCVSARRARSSRGTVLSTRSSSSTAYPRFTKRLIGIAGTILARD